ncbi:MAG: hypothetical protein KC652_05560 [Cyanobacteria bacterium HKST-UBA01]|nr:hypothetical protein [Cyanobacteria bacterium HKST-UBA01]
MKVASGANIPFSNWQKLDNVKVKGWPLVRYCRQISIEELRNIRRYPIKNPKRLRSINQVVSTTNSLSLPYNWVHVYVNALGAPCPPNCFPLYFSTYNGSRLIGNRLNLLSITNENVDGNFFAIPDGYKEAKDDLYVYFGGSEFAELFFRTRVKRSSIPGVN